LAKIATTVRRRRRRRGRIYDFAPTTYYKFFLGIKLQFYP
jgi:hypothetical protein